MNSTNNEQPNNPLHGVKLANYGVSGRILRVA